MYAMRQMRFFLPVVTICAGCGADNSASAGSARAQATNSALSLPVPRFADTQQVTVAGYAGDVMEPFISRDGTTLFFNNSNAEAAATDLFYAVRVGPTQFTFKGRVGGTNWAGALDAVASLDRENNFYFISTRSYRTDLNTVFAGRYRSGAVTSVKPVVGISRRHIGYLDSDAEINAAGDRLYYTESLFTGDAVPQSSVLKVAARSGNDLTPLANSDRLLANVNTATLVYAPSTSSDGLELYFTRLDRARQGPEPHIYVAVRSKTSDPFGPPVRITAAAGFVEAPSLSGDGKYLYYHVKTGARHVLAVLTRQRPR